MPEHERTRHPIDRLMREIIETQRSVSPQEIESILGHIATAPFDSRLVRVPIIERGVMYGERRLLPWDDSLFVHLVRRVVRNQEWAMGTTSEQYVQDLQRAARAAEVRVVVYARRGGSIAGILAPTEFVVPAERLGPEWMPTLFVVYSADRGIIVSGYQAPSREELAIPEDAQWLL